MNKPFSFNKSENFSAAAPIAGYSQFSPRDPKLESAGYLEWNFLDHEKDKTPYKAGSYLGTKRIVNIGAGARYQPQAMWHKTATGDTAYSPMILATVDVFAEMPFKKGGQTAFNLYGAYTFSDFGPGYLRQGGANGIATGSNSVGLAPVRQRQQRAVCGYGKFVVFPGRYFDTRHPQNGIEVYAVRIGPDCRLPRHQTADFHLRGRPEPPHQRQRT